MQKTVNLRKTINQDWKEFLKKYTTQQDVAKISLQHDMGYHTLHGIKNRSINISNEKNKEALESLMKEAKKNALVKKAEVEKDIETMSLISECYEIIETD